MSYKIVAIELEREIHSQIRIHEMVKVKRAVMLFLYLKTKNAHWNLSAVISMVCDNCLYSNTRV